MLNFEIDVYQLNGETTGKITLDEKIFGIEPNKMVMHELLTAELAAARQGTASTKTRGEVSGGGAKPFRQKGTGRARQGSSRAPHMVGGGTVHGPKPRSYDKKVNKKAIKLALRSALSLKFANNEIIVLDNITMEKPKTKEVLEFTKKLNIVDKKNLYVIDDITEYYLYLSARNIRDTQVIMPANLSIYWLLKQNTVILTKSALQQIEEVLI